MFQPRDDDLVSGLQVLASEAVHDQVHRIRGASGEDNLTVGCRIQEFGDLLPRPFEGDGGVRAEGVHAAVHVRVFRRVVEIEAVDDRLRHLAARCAVEIDQGVAACALLQDGEILANPMDVELRANGVLIVAFQQSGFHGSPSGSFKIDAHPTIRHASSMPDGWSLSLERRVVSCNRSRRSRCRSTRCLRPWLRCRRGSTPGRRRHRQPPLEARSSQEHRCRRSFRFRTTSRCRSSWSQQLSRRQPAPPSRPQHSAPCSRSLQAAPQPRCRSTGCRPPWAGCFRSRESPCSWDRSKAIPDDLRPQP